MTAPAFASVAHTRDADCTVDPGALCCTVCGVDHSAQCGRCGGRGFHADDCPASDAAWEDVCVAVRNLRAGDYLPATNRTILGVEASGWHDCLVTYRRDSGRKGRALWGAHTVINVRRRRES